MKGFSWKDLENVVYPFTTNARIKSEPAKTITKPKTEVTKRYTRKVTKSDFSEMDKMAARLKKMTAMKRVDPSVIEDLDLLLIEIVNKSKAEYFPGGKLSKEGADLVTEFMKHTNLLLDAWISACMTIPDSYNYMRMDTQDKISSIALKLADQISKITL